MAPRLPARTWTACARGAGLALCLGLASQGRAETITGAWYDGPTERYGHGILGDAIEYGDLIIETEDWANKVRYRIRLPEDHVFEDIAPRLWDITGDGDPEVVVIETDMARGGSLAVYNQSGKLAETPHIGRTNRWLAPVAAADFDGDGRVEVAFVDRPHLAKTLRIFEWDGVVLRLETEISGLTNHRIGEDFITGGLRICEGEPQMVIADADWSHVMVVRFADGAWRAAPVAAFSQEAIATALDCR